MSSNNVNKKNNSSRGHGGMKVVEKPKDFMGSIKKLIGSLRDFKVLIFVAIVLAGLSSILSLVTPNKLNLIISTNFYFFNKSTRKYSLFNTISKIINPNIIIITNINIFKSPN